MLREVAEPIVLGGLSLQSVACACCPSSADFWIIHLSLKLACNPSCAQLLPSHTLLRRACHGTAHCCPCSAALCGWFSPLLNKVVPAFCSCKLLVLLLSRVEIILC